MITLKLPKGESINLIDEISQAHNIKDSNNRKNTIRGLKKIQVYL